MYILNPSGSVPSLILQTSGMVRADIKLLLLFLSVLIVLNSNEKTIKSKRRGKEKAHTDRIILEHAERSTLARPDHGPVVASQGHGDESDGDGAGFGCWRCWVSLRA